MKCCRGSHGGASPLQRISNGELDGVKPKVIVLLIGTNNLPKDMQNYLPKTPVEDAAGVKAILDVMNEKQPQAKILLISVFPREEKINASNPDYREDLNPKIKELNALLAKFDDGKQIKFLDIYGKFLGPDGKLHPWHLHRSPPSVRKRATTSGPWQCCRFSPNGLARQSKYADNAKQMTSHLKHQESNMNRFRDHASALAILSLFAASLFAAAPVSQTTPATTIASRLRALLTEDPSKASPVRSNAAGATNNGWVNRHNGFVTTAKAAAAGTAPIDLYMEGDSITDFWKSRFAANWNKNLAPWHAGDFGISGDRTQNLLYRLENGELDGVNPKVIVLNIGTNNLAFNATYGMNSVDETIKGIKAVLDLLQQKAPKARILVIGIYAAE